MLLLLVPIARVISHSSATFFNAQYSNLPEPTYLISEIMYPRRHQRGYRTVLYLRNQQISRRVASVAPVEKFYFPSFYFQPDLYPSKGTVQYPSTLGIRYETPSIQSILAVGASGFSLNRKLKLARTARRGGCGADRVERGQQGGRQAAEGPFCLCSYPPSHFGIVLFRT